MKTNPMAKHYAHLSPPERFRLLMAAGGRDDKAEQDRLMRAGARIELSVQDHVPYAQAFAEVAMLTFLAVLDHACRFLDLLPLAAPVTSACSAGEDAGDEVKPANHDNLVRPCADLALAAAYVLQAQTEGWKLFCRELNVPFFSAWEALPGFGRLQRALADADQLAVSPEQFLGHLNTLRPTASSKLTVVPGHLTAAGMAAGIEEVYRWRVGWWGG